MGKMELFENTNIPTAMLSLSQSLLSSISVWTAKQFVNNSVDGEHFICFRDKNVVFKFIWISVGIALVSSTIYSLGDERAASLAPWHLLRNH